jgi:WD40 repeat protein
MFGQKKLQLANIIRTLDGVSLECVSDVQEVSDWILEADFWKEQSMVALVTAHNNIVIWDWVKKSPLTSFECEIQCILYSANLSHSINQRVIVASGTVFNQVLLWKLNGDHDPHTSRVKVNLTLTGHDGVIFGIRFSPDYKRVCSVSDDRTVRVWSLPLGWEEDYNQTVMCADIVLYGHLARVWDAHFLHNGVISSSEDLTCRVWNYSGECIQILEGHKGRNIWSMAVNEDQSLIATGGGDCAILLTQLHKSTRPKSVLFKLRLGGQEECKDFVRGVCLLTTDSVLCLTDQGKLYSVIVDSTRKMYTWTCLSEDTRFASYSVVSVSPCRQVVALGNLEGKLKVASLNITTEGVSLGPEVVQTAHRGKIFSLVFLESDKPGISMVTTGPEGQGVWWRVIPGTIYRVVPLVNGHTSLVLPPCKHRWVTAAAAVPLQKSEECVLVCGDRKGSLHSYLVQEGSKGIEEPLLPVSSLLGLHGQHGVSSLRHCNGRVLSTGREGNIRHYSVGQDGVLVEIAKFKVFKGFDWVERMYFLGGQEYVVGFHSTDFIIYNLTKGQTVASLQCGGGHRSWDVCMNTEGTGKHGFACVKGSEIHFHHIELSLEPRQVVLEEGFHGRETNCMMMYHSSKDLSYIVTGSEDCSVRLFCYNSNTNSLSPVASYEGHISSVRALASSVSCVEMGKTLLFSGGGRARLIAWEVQGVANPRPCPPELVSLAKTSFSLLSDRKRRKLQKNPTLPQPPADSRIMGLTAFPLSLLTKSHSTDNLHCVIAACSDAIVRIYIFDAEARIFHQIEHTLQHPNCLFCIQHIIISNSNGEDKLSGCTGFHSNFPSCATTSCAYILVGGASGEIHVWRLNTLLEDWMQGHLNGLKSEAITKEEATARNLKDVFESEGHSLYVYVCTLVIL